MTPRTCQIQNPKNVQDTKQMVGLLKNTQRHLNFEVAQMGNKCKRILLYSNEYTKIKYYKLKNIFEFHVI